MGERACKSVYAGRRRILTAVAVGIFLGIFIKLFAADILLVSGQSMEPLINEGARIFVSKLAYGAALPFSSELFVQWTLPQKDDVVIYIYDNKAVVKRCAAVEGDTLEYSRNITQDDALPDSFYRVSVNGKSYPLDQAQYQRFKNMEKVPQGMIFAVGDNSAKSFDSRHYGFVSVRNILGKVLCR